MLPLSRFAMAKLGMERSTGPGRGDLATSLGRELSVALESVPD